MPLSTPFRSVAGFLTGADKYQMVPFRQWEVRDVLNKPNPPKVPPVNLTQMPGLATLLSLIPGAGDVINDLRKLLGDLSKGQLAQIEPELAQLIPDSLQFVRQQLAVGLSLGALFNVGGDTQKIIPAVTAAYQSYFFAQGFSTLEGGRISAPTFPSVDAKDASLEKIEAEVRHFASRKTADQYIRDLTRIAVEASGDALFSLPDRYNRLIGRNDAIGKLEQSWFKGFADLAESTVISTLEEAVQGVGAFSGNPLIAASIATFAGAAARKLTQDVFFLEINL